MWLAIKDLYTDVKAQVLYSGELSREFDVSQGTGQGRIFAPFMYKVYINSLLQNNNITKRSHTQLDSRKQVIAFQDRVITINIKEAQHPLK